jgi:hypothetical protein
MERKSSLSRVRSWPPKTLVRGLPISEAAGRWPISVSSAYVVIAHRSALTLRRHSAAPDRSSFDLDTPGQLRCVADSPIGNKLLRSHSYQRNSANNVHHHGGAGPRTLLVIERGCLRLKMMDPLRHEFRNSKNRFRQRGSAS